MDSTSLIIGLISGSIGVGYVVYGRKRQRYAALIAGVLLCVYPYVVDGIWLSLIINSIYKARIERIERDFEMAVKQCEQ